MTGRLEGRIAVITGGSGGIGQAIAARFAKEGADIAVADLQAAPETEALVAAQGRRFFHSHCDISSPEAVARFGRDVTAALGSADILVNNAAIYSIIPFTQLTFATWKSTFSVNLDSHFLMAHAFVPGMIEKGFGRIIGMSTAGVFTQTKGFSHYVATKAGIVGFCNALAGDLGDHGITVNAIAPSLVVTPGTTATDDPADPDSVFARLAAAQTIHRSQTPADVVGTAVFLASDDANFVTGQVIGVDGGLTRM